MEKRCKIDPIVVKILLFAFGGQRLKQIATNVGCLFSHLKKVSRDEVGKENEFRLIKKHQFYN
jgi:Sec-independent protein translocase protein TatA